MQICITPEIGVSEIFVRRNLGFLANNLGTILFNGFKMPLMHLDHGRPHSQESNKFIVKEQLENGKCKPSIKCNSYPKILKKHGNSMSVQKGILRMETRGIHY